MYRRLPRKCIAGRFFGRRRAPLPILPHNRTPRRPPRRHSRTPRQQSLWLRRVPKSLSPQSLRHSCPHRRIPPDGRILVAFFRQYGKHGHCRLSTHIPQIGRQKSEIRRLDAQFGSDQPPARHSCRRQTAKLSRNTATPSPPTHALLHKGEICSNRICFAELEKNVYLCMYGFQRGKNPAFCHCPVL